MGKRKALLAILILFVLTGSCTSGTGESSLITIPLEAVPDSPNWAVRYTDFPLLAKEEGLRQLSRWASLDDRVAWWIAIQSRVLCGLPFGGIHESWGFDITEVDIHVAALGSSIVSGDLDTDAMIQRFIDYGYQEGQYRGAPIFLRTPQVTQEVSNSFPKAIAVLESGPQAALVSMAFAIYGESLSEAETAVKQSIDTYLDGNSLADNEDLVEVASLLTDYPSAFLCSSAFLTDRLMLHLEPGLELPSAPGFLEQWSVLAIGNRQEANRSFLQFILTFDTAEMAENNVEVLRQRLTEGRISPPWASHLPSLFSDIFQIQSVEASGRHVLATVELIGEWAGADRFFTTMISVWDFGFLLPGDVGDD